LSEGVPVALVVLTKADALLKVGADATRDDVASRMDAVRLEAFDQVVQALGANIDQTPCVVVAAETALEAHPDPVGQHFVATIGALWKRLDRERPALLALRQAIRLRAPIAELSEVLAKDQRSSEARLAALEGKRFPDPGEFRRRLLGRVGGAIEKGADDVLAAAIERLHAAMEGLRSEWTQQIATCTSRSDLDARIAALNEGAVGRIADALEQTAELVARELSSVTETLEVWGIEEIRTHYRLVQRLGAEALAPIVSELTRDDLERELSLQPFGGALEAFEKQRVGYGLGGVAGGALIGTLIAPGIGTAIGAVLGVFAGLLKGTDSLKQDCIAKIDACINDAESHARVQLESKRPELSTTIRVSLDEALEEAFQRLNDAIARLMAVERRAIDGERAKIQDATTARDKLADCDQRLARLSCR
jgi:hypothetical protein